MSRTPMSVLVLALAAVAGISCPAQAQFLGIFGKKKEKASPRVIEPLDAKTLGYSVAWSSNLALPEDVTIEQIEQLGDMIVVIDSEHLITAVAVEDGRLLWQTPIGMETASFFAPVRWADKIVISSNADIVLLNASDGRIVERQRLDWAASTAPLLIDHMAVFGAVNGRLFGHDLRSGFAKWAYQMGAQITAKPTRAGNDIFAATDSGVYGMFNREGVLVWMGKAHDRITASGVIERNSVIFPSVDQSLYCISRITGRDQWIYRTTEPLTEPLTLVERVAVLQLNKPQIVGIDATSGKELWRIDGRAQALPINDRRLALNFGNSITMIEPRTGAPLADAQTLPTQTALADESGALLLVTPDGRLVRLTPGT